VRNDLAVLLSCSLLVFLPHRLVAQTPAAVLTQPIIESQLVSLEGNTPPPALVAANDRGPVDDAMRFEHLLLVLKRTPDAEAALRELIDAMHDPHSTAQYHHWLTPQEVGRRFGLAPQDLEVLQEWLKSQGFAVNKTFVNGLVIDFSGTAAQIRSAFHTEIHVLVLPNGERHIANVSDPRIPAALAAAVEGINSLHDFFPKSRLQSRGALSFDHVTGTWTPHFNVGSNRGNFHALAPYDFATIYHVLPLWQQGYTGKGITIAAIEDSNLYAPSDWQTFRLTFGLDKFTQGSFAQIYPAGCANPGQNGDEIEAALDVEWASATAPDAHVELSACANTASTSGLDLAILGLIDTAPPDIITDSYGLCETITGATEVALENREAQLATLEGTTFFIAQGDNGADECAPVERASYSFLGINSGDNTASAYAVDVGGTDFMAQYNADVSGVPLSIYWSATNDPVTKASALSYIPEIPWNDACTSALIYSDPVNGGFSQSYGSTGFCNSALGQTFLNDVAGSGGPSTCFTGKPAIPGVVGGTCAGNPKPAFQKGVPGVPNDGERDQPDLALFASNGVWGSLYVECMSDPNQFGFPCSPQVDAVVEGGGGTSFAAPAMAGIQALIDQKAGRQGDANYVYYALAKVQFGRAGAAACNASMTTGALPAADCIFHDVTLGDMDIPCGQTPQGKFVDCYGASGSTIIGELSAAKIHGEPAFAATVGYDLATGLGSVDATNLFDAWPLER